MSVPIFPRPAPLSEFPEHACRIAEIIARWNSIEDACAHLLTVFAGTDPFQCDVLMAAVVSSAARLDVVRAAGEYALKDKNERLAELNDIFDLLRDRLKVRNQYAHAVYVVNKKDKLCIVRRRYEYGDPKNIRVVNLNELQTEVEHSVALFNRLRKFHSGLWNEIPEEVRHALTEIWSQRRLPPQANRE